MDRRSFVARGARLGAAALLGARLGTPRPARAAQKFTFALNWFPVGDHCAYYVAQQKGYFATAGLEVGFENSKGSGDSLSKVATGRVDAGLGEVAALMGLRARGAEIRTVGMVFDRTPLNVFSRQDLPARVPKDLEGHTIGAPPGDGQRQVWPAFAKVNGLAAASVTWVNIDPAAKPAALIEKRVDFVADYSTGLPLYEKPLGKGNVVTLPWSRFGMDIYSMSLAASETTMRERGDELRSFVAAAYRGWRDVMADPEGSLALYKKSVPEIDLGFIAENMALGVDLMRTTRYAQNGIGWIDPAKMAATADVVNTYMGLPKKLDAAEIYTDKYWTPVEMPLVPT